MEFPVVTMQLHIVFEVDIITVSNKHIHAQK